MKEEDLELSSEMKRNKKITIENKCNSRNIETDPYSKRKIKTDNKGVVIERRIKKENDIQDENVKVGSNVSIGYIPQNITFEDDTATILDVARKNYNGTETHLRAALAKFMFNGDNVFKKASINLGDISFFSSL